MIGPVYVDAQFGPSFTLARRWLPATQLRLARQVQIWVPMSHDGANGSGGTHWARLERLSLLAIAGERLVGKALGCSIWGRCAPGPGHGSSFDETASVARIQHGGGNGVPRTDCAFSA
jgi:hypothetical protein